MIEPSDYWTHRLERGSTVPERKQMDGELVVVEELGISGSVLFMDPGIFYGSHALTVKCIHHAEIAVVQL